MCEYPPYKESKEDRAEREQRARERLQRERQRAEEEPRRQFRKRTDEASLSRPFIDGGLY